MRAIVTEFEKFNFAGFADKSISLAQKFIVGGFEVLKTDMPGGVPEEFEHCTKLDVLMNEINAGKALFFMFGFNSTADSVACADGKTYPIDEDDDFIFGEEESLGYLLQMSGEVLIINSAVHCSGGCPVPQPSIDVITDCGAYDKPLTTFVNKFINA